MKTEIKNRLFYRNLGIGQLVTVQAFSGELTQNFYTGIITNMDGQNIVVEVNDRIHTDDSKIRSFEACNPAYAVVTEYRSL